MKYTGGGSSLNLIATPEWCTPVGVPGHLAELGLQVLQEGQEDGWNLTLGWGYTF